MMATKFILYTTGLLTVVCVLILGFSISDTLNSKTSSIHDETLIEYTMCGNSLASFPYISETINADIGKQLFRVNCKQCHNPSMNDDMTGPALGGFIDRWNQDTTAVHQFIKNPDGYMQRSLDPRIKALASWSPSSMNAFSSLTYDEVRSIIEYVEWADVRN